MKIIRKEDLKLPDEPGMCPQIDWGMDFEEFDKDHKIRYLQKLCSALNHSADLIQTERNNLLVEANKLQKMAEFAEEAVAIQKNIVIKAITSHNAEKQELIKILQELETQNKSLTSKLRKYED